MLARALNPEVLVGVDAEDRGDGVQLVQATVAEQAADERGAGSSSTICFPDSKT